MKYQLKPFKEIHLGRAVKLFVDYYGEARKENPLLPSTVIDRPQWIHENLQCLLENTGTTIWNGSEMLGYMITGLCFKYKGQDTAWIPEHAHAALSDDKSLLYQLMYGCLAREWIGRKIHLHLICHLAHDVSLKDILFELGFGALVAEQIRDLSQIEDVPAGEVVNEKDVSKLIDIEAEHRLYYKESPIFVLKDNTPKSVKTSLERHIDESDEIFVYYDNEEPCAYMILGRINQSGEGFLLRKSNTAQIKSIYAKPKIRGHGIGKLLLNIAIRWAKENGYERLFAEHETANIFGGNFWKRYFTPMVYASMRYVDTEIEPNRD
jgi:GNAT superfamily N-acetyltransferase